MSAQVFMLILEVPGDLGQRLALIHSGASLLNIPVCRTWCDPTLNKLQVGCQMRLFGLGWGVFVLGRGLRY